MHDRARRRGVAIGRAVDGWDTPFMGARIMLFERWSCAAFSWASAAFDWLKHKDAAKIHAVACWS